MGDGLAGSAELFLAPNVIPLDPEAAVFKAMLAGWADQRVRMSLPSSVDVPGNKCGAKFHGGGKVT